MVSQTRHEPPPDAPGAGEQDAAGKSLADALRLSFRLLSLIMIVVMVALLLTGLSQVQPSERGIRMLFGKIQGQGNDRVLEEGLRWSWPEPIGQVLKVHTAQRTLQMDDFWYYESAQTELGQSSPNVLTRPELRPGWDGALLTGDRALVHAKLTVLYRVGQRGDRIEPEELIRFVCHVTDAEEFVRSAVCNAAIQVAATKTVDAILTTEQGRLDEFVREIRVLAQARLDEMQSGIRIESVKTADLKVPLAAKAAFDAVASARQEEDRLRNEAVGAANTTLANAAGDAYRILVGPPERPGQEGLLADYAGARERGEEKAADQLLARINDVLTSEAAGGTVKQILFEAETYRSRVRQQVEARAETFNRLLGKYLETPQLMLQDRWVETIEQILGSPTVETYYLTPGQKTVLRVNQDPEIRRRILEETLKVKEGEPGAQGPRPPG